MKIRQWSALAVLVGCARAPDPSQNLAAAVDPVDQSVARVDALDVFVVLGAPAQVDPERLARFAALAEAAADGAEPAQIDENGACRHLEPAAEAALAQIEALEVLQIEDLALEDWPSEGNCYNLPCDDADRQVEARNCARRSRAIAIADATGDL